MCATATHMRAVMQWSVSGPFCQPSLLLPREATFVFLHYCELLPFSVAEITSTLNRGSFEVANTTPDVGMGWKQFKWGADDWWMRGEHLL